MRVGGRRRWQAAMLATSAVRRHTPGTMSTTDAIAAGGAPEPAHATAELPQELLRQLRDGLPLPAGALRGFVQGIADGRVGDAQVGAFAMAVRLRGLPPADTAVLTLAMRDSGACLDWGDAGLDGPLLDKHSTGGIGDLASLTLGPMVAACGGYLPMLSGRGLGHTGGTLDKLEAIAGYRSQVDLPTLRAVVREAGIAIVAAGGDLAPADRRLYAIRDVTATVDSIALITASILSKKLAAGTRSLVLDVKCGSGATMDSPEQSQALARSLVDVSCAAGLPCMALLTDMQQPLTDSVGNALELREALAYLRGEETPPRLHALCLALGSEMLRMGGLAGSDADARRQLLAARDSGRAFERFAKMVHALGGRAGALEAGGGVAGAAPLVEPVFAAMPGRVAAIDARALGMAVVALGGGRSDPGDAIDPRVGLTEVAEIGAGVAAGQPLALVHAASREALAAAQQRVRAAFRLVDPGMQVAAPELLLGRVTAGSEPAPADPAG